MNLDKFAHLDAGLSPTPVVPGRVIRVDADGLAYRYGGFPAGWQQALAEVARACAAAQAARFELVFTPGDSNKGHRYAISRRKPYQGHRSGGRRPQYWELFRRKLEADYRAVSAGSAEADDRLALANGEDFVIYSQDKDLRMVTGCHHLDYKTRKLVHVPPGAVCVGEADTGEVYGWLWFWLQMLHGDSADGIPGLPEHNGKRVGPAAADRLMVPGLANDECRFIVEGAYRTTYGADWDVELLEQACLLWMRTRAGAPWDDVLTAGPLAHAADDLARAREVIEQRVRAVQ